MTEDPLPNSGASTKKAVINKHALSWKRKSLYGLIVCVMTFLFCELLLMLLGIQTIADEFDPFVGFSSRFPLFEKRNPETGPAVYSTSKNRLSLFNSQTFPAEKADGTVRIFSLGGSTTYGRPYDDQTSFSGFLRKTLPVLDPSHKWEVINAGGISYASPRISLLIHELIQYQPDLFLIYTGHNEFLEDRTYSSLIKTPESIRQLGGLATRSRTVSLMHRLIHGSAQDDEEHGGLQEVETKLDRAVGPSVYHRDEAWHEEVIQQFRSNLERIISVANSINCPVIFVTPASKLRDCEPFKSEHRSTLTVSGIREFDSHFVKANKAFENDQLDEALIEVQAALLLDDQYAHAHFLSGEILYAKQNYQDAKQAFQRAIEEDVCPLRAKQELTHLVRESATTHQLPLVDFAKLIETRSEQHIPGEDWFLDHVHPTIGGHRLLAKSLLEEIVDRQLATPNSDWSDDQYEIVADELEANIDPQQHAIALRNLAKVLGWAGKQKEADRLAAQAIELLPNDAETHSMAGFAAIRNGSLAEAQSHFVTALEQEPRDVRSLSGLGTVFTQQGDLKAAKKQFEKAISLAPKHVPAWFNLGNVLKELGHLDDAASAYQTALELEPNQPDTLKNLGLTYLAQGEIEAGVKCFDEALSLEPNSSLRHAELGFVLIDAGDLLRSAKAFETALQLDSHCIPAMIGKGLVLEQQGNVAQALKVWKSILLIDPENQNAQQLINGR